MGSGDSFLLFQNLGGRGVESLRPQNETLPISKQTQIFHRLNKESIGKREERKEKKRGEERRFSICVNFTVLGFLFQSCSGDSVTQQDSTVYERVIHA